METRIKPALNKRMVSWLSRESIHLCTDSPSFHSIPSSVHLIFHNHDTTLSRNAIDDCGSRDNVSILIVLLRQPW